uniref:hypothetical protein n=1 Tax=Rheinheimera sp. TaxID=1869214 RepID=UPI0040472E38
MRKVLCVSLLLYFGSFQAVAGCDGPICSGEISSFAESLKVTSEGLMVAVVKDVDRKALSCELIQDKFIEIPAKGKTADAVYSLLLTAFAANAQVVIEFNTGNKLCEVGSVELIPSN